MLAVHAIDPLLQGPACAVAASTLQYLGGAAGSVDFSSS